MRELSSIKRNLATVVYGPSGSGKTTFAASAPKPMMYVDIRDRGTDSISDVKGIKVREVEEFADFEDTYWWLRKNPKAFKTVVIDTCTQLNTMLVQELHRDKKKTGRPGDWGTMTKQDWGQVAARMKEWLGNFRDLTDLGMDVVFIAQDRIFNLNDEESEAEQLLAPEVGPALSPSVAKTLNASCDVIVNTFIRERQIVKKVDGKTIKRKKIEYCLGVGPSALYMRKIRKPKSVALTDAVLVDPAYEDLIDIVKGR